MTPRILIAIPAHNEAATVASVVTEARHHGHPVLVIDDGSTDGTGERARVAGATVLTVEKIKESVRHGGVRTITPSRTILTSLWSAMPTGNIQSMPFPA